VVATADAGRRERRNEEGLVELHERKQFNAEARALACLYATYLMGWNKEHSRRGQEHVALASCTLVCYDLGYKTVTGKYGLQQWLKQLKDSLPNSTARNIFHSRHRGTTSQMENIETAHPTYLHRLYQESTSILGNDATYAEIAAQMNLLSTVDDARPTIRLDKWSLQCWFKNHNGKEKKPIVRPLLTIEHKQTRLTYVTEMRAMEQQGAIFGYLDEAWKYLWSLRGKNEASPTSRF
jgi:hypothetical protein